MLCRVFTYSIVLSLFTLSVMLLSVIIPDVHEILYCFLSFRLSSSRITAKLVDKFQ